MDAYETTLFEVAEHNGWDPGALHAAFGLYLTAPEQITDPLEAFACYTVYTMTKCREANKRCMASRELWKARALAEGYDGEDDD